MLTITFASLSSPAYAQCTSNASSCVTCHDTQGLRPVLQGTQIWHVDHGFGDLCSACHGGDPSAALQEQAHLGLRMPLADPAVSCAGCHAADAQARAERYRAVLSSAVTVPVTSVASGHAASVVGVASLVNRLLAGLAALLALALYVVVRRELADERIPLLAWLRAKTWSPYAAGVLLGLVVAFSVVFCGRPLAVSGAFDKLAAYPGRWLFPSSQYYGHIMSPGITWQVWLVLGLLGGAFISSKLASETGWRWLPDTQWSQRFGTGRTRRLVLAFLGGALVQVGAGIAGGCTSGLAISGGAVLAPAAFVFMAGMFAGGIPTAWLWYRGSAS